MKRVSDPNYEAERRRRHRLAQKESEITYDAKVYPLAARHNRTPKGYIVQRGIRQRHMPGDEILVFGKPGKEDPTYLGGEGGPGWTVPSTKW
jgi:hypothetical protein